MQDWEPRALPSEARCRVWAEKGGTWHLTTSTADGAFCMARGVRSGYPSDADKQLWRPWNGDIPATWSKFHAATHPLIPEGWVKAGDFDPDPPGRNVHSAGIEIHPAAMVGFGRYHSGDGFSTAIRRILPAIPEGWEAVGEWSRPDGCPLNIGGIHPSEIRILGDDGEITDHIRKGAAFFLRVCRVPPPADWEDVPKGVKILPLNANAVAVWNGDTQIGVACQQDDGKWELRKMNLSGKSANQPSLPAAIVALTGRREKG